MTTEYRNALHVTAERIAALGDADLGLLMTELLYAQAYRCSADVSRITVNTESRAKDDGCDGWSPRPSNDDPWLGSVDTCWQFKAGSAGEPARLTGEITKLIPRATLVSGGRFVAVTNASTNGKKGEDDRLKELRSEALAAGLPTEKIEVIGSERLAKWCNQHPAVAARWSGGPEGLWVFEKWRLSPEHQLPWQSTAALEQQIEAALAGLDFETGSLLHLHVEGPPGVGKTRFALELCRRASWSTHVVYVRHASDVRLSALIDGAAAKLDARLVIVADEAQAGQLLPLLEAIEHGQGRLRLVTIGHSKTPDSRRIPSLPVAPLDREPMATVVRGWYPSMPPEHVEFVVRFADGYVRLARLTADAVIRDPSSNVRRLLDQDDVRVFLDNLLGPGDRSGLYVVAALNSVGWTGDVQSEGEAVARHLGLDWNFVRANVEEFDRRLGVAPRGGRYRYISPKPLGIYLAVQAWATFPDRLKTLPDALPNEEAREAYYGRLEAIASSPYAREFAREALASFFRLDDFVDPRAARRWSALSASDPSLAARNIMRALLDSTPDERARITERARRETVWTLVRLAWKPIAFRDAAIALALLAEAENETWSNNATGEFVARFQVFLGGTGVPYVERLSVLDELVVLDRIELTKLVVRALKQVSNQFATRMNNKPASDDLPEPEWRPRTPQELLACHHQAIERLRSIAKLGAPDLQEELVKAASDLSMLLRHSAVRESVSAFFETIREAYPASRELLRRVIAAILLRERQYWKELGAEDLAAIEAIHTRFEDLSLTARLRQYVGPPTWDRDDQAELVPLARELVADRESLAAEWPWLTSGEAADAWRLGQALATADSPGELDSTLPNLPGRGRDLRTLCGYVYTRRQQHGTKWFDEWTAAQLERAPGDMQLLLEVSWRCGGTVSTARLLAASLRAREVEPDFVGQLAFGTWGDDLPVGAIGEVLEALADRGHGETALHILDHRLRARPAEAEQFEDVALKLVTDTSLIRADRNLDYYWSQVAIKFIPRHARQIAAAILAAQSDRKRISWFASHGQAGSVLRRCVEADPTSVWQDLRSYLASPDDAYMFSVGFPKGIVDQMPVEDVLRWASENRPERVSLLARLVNLNLSADDTLASRLLGSFGDDEDVASAFFSSFASGSWTGPSSEHWDRRADNLQQVVNHTSLPKLRRWAEDTARSLRAMAEGERQREEEEVIRRR